MPSCIIHAICYLLDSAGILMEVSIPLFVFCIWIKQKMRESEYYRTWLLHDCYFIASHAPNGHNMEWDICLLESPSHCTKVSVAFEYMF